MVHDHLHLPHPLASMWLYGRKSEDFPQDWAHIGHTLESQPGEFGFFSLRKPLKIKGKCSKEDSNLHGSPH
jgi:hypothetical protein